MASIIDCDQHLYESRNLWRDHIDPGRRDDALAIVDDELGYPLLTWRGQELDVADVQLPGETATLGERRNRRREGLRPEYNYDEALPEDYWRPVARVERIATMGLDQAVLFPNFGLLWERRLSSDLGALTANMAAWNRWCTAVVVEGGGRLHPVAHLTLRDPGWLDAQLAMLAGAGVRLAMIAPALVDGLPMSDPSHDCIWRAFVEHGVTPVFHVADQPRVFADGWYTDASEQFVPVIDAVFLSTAVSLALADLILNGTLDRNPALNIGVVELGSIWVPLFLLMLDGASDFTTRINGRPLAELGLRPSEYFRRQVRVASFSFEQPARLAAEAGDVFMCCSDYPHSEGTADPVADYRASGCLPETSPRLFQENVGLLLAGA